MKLVIIQWVDSTTLGERWHYGEEAKEVDVNECNAVGYIVSKDKRKVGLAQAVCLKTDSAINLLAIPMGCIKSIKPLG